MLSRHASALLVDPRDPRRPFTCPRSRHLVVPGAHGVGWPCLTEIQRRFLEAGSVEGLDVSCTKRLVPGKFQFDGEH